MKTINSYIIEKFKITKGIKNSKINLEEEILDILKKSSKTLYLDNIFDYTLGGDNMLLKELYVLSSGEIYYNDGRFGTPSKKVEKLSDLFSRSQLKKIYDYLINNEKFK